MYLPEQKSDQWSLVLGQGGLVRTGKVLLNQSWRLRASCSGQKRRG